MRTLLLLVLGALLVAAPAAAGVPAKALAPLEKVPVVKPSFTGEKAGLLDCSGAIEVSLGNTYAGDSTGLLGNVAGYGCGYWWEPAGEVVYHLFLAAPTMWEASLQSEGCDLDLAVLDQCDENAGCLFLADTGVVTTEPVSGDIYFVVDGVSEDGCPFTLTLTELPPPPAADFCDLVEPAGGTYFFGSTCEGPDQVQALACSPYPEYGQEAYFEILMPPGSSFTATVNGQSDIALWLLGACVEPFACLAFADEGLWGDAEVLGYANPGAQEARVFLVIDSYGAGTCGWYELEFASDSGAVPSQTMSLGGLKALYR